MFEEQIKEISSKVFDDKMSKIISLEKIILNSSYHVLSFNGTADYSLILQSFPNTLIENRHMLLKSVRVLVYAPAEIDELWNDTASEHFTIPVSLRINKMVDQFARGNRIEIIFNGSNLNIFPEDIATSVFNGMNPDLFVDNIYYNYKSKIQNIQARADIQVVDDLDTGALNVNRPFVRVQLEVYLY